MEYVNKKLKHNYDIINTYNCGMLLRGWELPALRNNGISLNECYCLFNNNILVIRGSYIKPHKSNIDKLIPETEYTRDRELLLNKNELSKIKKQIEQKGLTIIPYKIYLSSNNKFKCEIKICRGLKTHDKRQKMKEQDIEQMLKNAKK